MEVSHCTASVMFIVERHLKHLKLTHGLLSPFNKPIGNRLERCPNNIIWSEIYSHLNLRHLTPPRIFFPFYRSQLKSYPCLGRVLSFVQKLPRRVLKRPLTVKRK